MKLASRHAVCARACVCVCVVDEGLLSPGLENVENVEIVKKAVCRWSRLRRLCWG